MKSMICRVANSVMGYTLRPVKRGLKGRERGWDSWQEQRAPSPSVRGSGERCKLTQRVPGRSPGKFGFWSIWVPQKSRQNGQLAFESRGQQVNLGGTRAACPNVEPPLLCTTIIRFRYPVSGNNWAGTGTGTGYPVHPYWLASE